MSISHLVVGATNTGKTTFIKSLLSKVKTKNCLFIYDVNKEYTSFFPYPFIDFATFIEKATYIEGAILVIEEATIFLNNRSCNEFLNEILVRKRHTKNMIILVFHSMRSVPRYIYELSNYITIFKTNDSPEMSSRELKDERIGEIMQKVRESKDPHFKHTLKIY